jgi:hypothetical protein
MNEIVCQAASRVKPCLIQERKRSRIILKGQAAEGLRRAYQGRSQGWEEKILPTGYLRQLFSNQGELL